MRGTTVRAQFSPPEVSLDDELALWLSVGDTEVCSLEVGIRGDRVAGLARLDELDGGPLAAMQPMWMQLRMDDEVVRGIEEFARCGP